MADTVNHIDIASENLEKRKKTSREIIEQKLASLESTEGMSANEKITNISEELISYADQLNEVKNNLDQGEVKEGADRAISRLHAHISHRLGVELKASYEQMEQEIAQIENAEEKSVHKDAYMQALVAIRNKIDSTDEVYDAIIKDISSITNTLSDIAKDKVSAILQKEMDIEEGLVNKEKFAAAERIIRTELGNDAVDQLRDEANTLKESEFKNALLKMSSKLSDESREEIAKIVYKKGQKVQTANQIRFDAIEKVLAEELGEEKVLELQERVNDVSEEEFGKIIKNHLAIRDVEIGANNPPAVAGIEDMVEGAEEEEMGQQEVLEGAEEQDVAVELESLLNNMKQNIESGLTAKQKSQIDDLARTLLKQMEEGRANKMTAEQIVGVAKAKIAA